MNDNNYMNNESALGTLTGSVTEQINEPRKSPLHDKV